MLITRRLCVKFFNNNALGGFVKPTLVMGRYWGRSIMDERDQVAKRVNSLESFLRTPQADEIDKNQRAMLDIQLPAMKTYLAVLDERIRLIDVKITTSVNTVCNG